MLIIQSLLSKWSECVCGRFSDSRIDCSSKHWHLNSKKLSRESMNMWRKKNYFVHFLCLLSQSNSSNKNTTVNLVISMPNLKNQERILIFYALLGIVLFVIFCWRTPWLPSEQSSPLSTSINGVPSLVTTAEAQVLIWVVCWQSRLFFRTVKLKDDIIWTNVTVQGLSQSLISFWLSIDKT